MKLVIKDSKNQPDDFNGTYPNSNGGTETLYRNLLSNLPQEQKDKFQIICSRFRKNDPSKKYRVLWLHDLVEDPEVQNLADPTFRANFNKLVFVSDWQFNTYNQSLGVPYSESLILKNAIKPIDITEKPKDTINLIYHTTPHRGLEILVPVFLHLSKEIPELRLDVFSSFNAYGWPQRDAPYEKLFEICKDHPQINYHGYQPNDVVREHLKKTHIFAYPSIWKETSCIAAMEAMSAGCLVVCPNLGALTETVSNFGFVYHYDENMNKHANRFAEILSVGINKIKNNEVSFLQQTKRRADTLFNWDRRLEEWNILLNTIETESKKGA